MTQGSLKGYVQLVLAQLWLALSLILGKTLATTYPVSSLLALRFFIGAVAIFLYFSFSLSKQIEQFAQLTRREWGILLLQALCGGFLYNALVLYGLRFASATSAGIISSTIPACVALLSVLILKERLTKRRMFSIALAVLGVILMSVGRTVVEVNQVELFGIFWLFLAVFPGSLFVVLAKMMKTSINPLLVSWVLNAINAVLFFPLALSESWPVVSWTFIGKVTAYSLLGSVLFFFFWFRGLQTVSANASGLFIGLNPVFTTLFASILLGEQLLLLDGVGMFCVLSSLVVGIVVRSVDKVTLKRSAD